MVSFVKEQTDPRPIAIFGETRLNKINQKFTKESALVQRGFPTVFNNEYIFDGTD